MNYVRCDEGKPRAKMFVEYTKIIKVKLVKINSRCILTFYN